MKPIISTAKFLLMILFMNLFVNGAFANNFEEINERIVRFFKKDFASAENVSWERSQGSFKATFRLNDQQMSAYYSEDGKLVAVVRNILSVQLPINLLTEIKNQYPEFWITDLFEMLADGTTTYYITIQNPDQELVLTSQGTTGWDIFKKTRKQ